VSVGLAAAAVGDVLGVDVELAGCSTLPPHAVKLVTVAATRQSAITLSVHLDFTGK
jgi:hypothetical protein